MGPKKVTLVFVLTAALLLLAPSLQAKVQFDVFSGYDDVVPERSWFPITCEVDNDGPAFNAMIEVSANGPDAAPFLRAPVDLPTHTRKRVFLPIFSAASSWDLRLVDESGHVLAEKTAQATSNPALRGFPVVAGLARSIAGLPVFPDVYTRQQQDVKFDCARLQTAFFPDNPLTLEGINLLYLNSTKALELSVPQVNALVAWVENGGHLVVGVEQITDVNGTPWLRHLLPCELTSMREAPAGAFLNAWLQGAPPPSVLPPPPHRLHSVPASEAQNLSGIIVTLTPDGAVYQTNNISGVSAARLARSYWLSNSDGTFSRYNAAGLANLLALRGLPPANSPHRLSTNASPEFDSATLPLAAATLRYGKILIGNASTPLAIQGNRGRGLITVLAFSPEREPFLSWDGRQRFWMRLAGIPPSNFEQQQSNDPGYLGSRLGSDALFGAMIDSKQAHKLPLGWLLLLLAAYLIVIGPLDHYWLKKINRQMLTWITFPCYVLFFSVLIYWIGFHLRNGELEWNELNVVDILDSEDGAVFQGQTYGSIYSPVNGHYPLAASQPFAAVRSEFTGRYGLPETPRVSALLRGNSFSADAFVPVWTSQLFVSDWVQRGPAPLSFAIAPEGNGWRVVIDNNLDHKIGPLRVAVEGRIYDLGDLDENQSRTNLLERAQGQTMEAFLSPYANAFRGATHERRSNFGNNDDTVPDIAAGASAASFISLLNQSGSEYEDYGAPAGLDLSRFARSGYGVLLAWDDGHSLTAPIDQFKANRKHRRSLMRVVTPLPPPNT